MESRRLTRSRSTRSIHQSEDGVGDLSLQPHSVHSTVKDAVDQRLPTSFRPWIHSLLMEKPSSSISHNWIQLLTATIDKRASGQYELPSTTEHLLTYCKLCSLLTNKQECLTARIPATVQHSCSTYTHRWTYGAAWHYILSLAYRRAAVDKNSQTITKTKTSIMKITIF